MNTPFKDTFKSLLFPGLIALAAFGLRFGGITHFTPYLWSPDEYHYVHAAIDLFADEKVHTYFTNPPFYTVILHYAYMSMFAVQVLLGQFPFDVEAYANHAMQHLEWFLFVGRLLNCFLASATAFIMWFLAGELGLKRLKWLPASLLALLPLHVSYSMIAVNDILLVFFTALFLFALLRFRRLGDKASAIFLGIAFGLGMMAKYTLCTYAPAFAFVLWEKRKDKQPLHLPVLVLTISVSAIAACPWWIHRPHNVLAGLKAVMVAGGDRFYGQHASALQVASAALVQNFGWLGIGAVVLGIGFLSNKSVRDRAFWASLLLPLLLYIMLPTLFIGRYAFPLFIPMCLLCGLGLEGILGKQKTKHLALATAFLMLVHPMLLSGKKWILARRPDNKTIVTNWCVKNLPPDVPILADMFAMHWNAANHLDAFYTWNLREYPDSLAVKRVGFGYYVFGTRLINEQMNKSSRERWDFTQAGHWIRDHSNLTRTFPVTGSSSLWMKRIFPGNNFGILHRGQTTSIRKTTISPADTTQ